MTTSLAPAISSPAWGSRRPNPMRAARRRNSASRPRADGHRPDHGGERPVAQPILINWDAHQLACATRALRAASRPAPADRRPHPVAREGRPKRSAPAPWPSSGQCVHGKLLMVVMSASTSNCGRPEGFGAPAAPGAALGWDEVGCCGHLVSPGLRVALGSINPLRPRVHACRVHACGVHA
jgi:hypothetical protein